MKNKIKNIAKITFSVAIISSILLSTIAPLTKIIAEEPQGPQFDGKAYIIWSCGTGICYKYYEDIPNFDDGNSHYIKDTTIEADNNPGQAFNIQAQYKYWASKKGFEEK